MKVSQQKKYLKIIGEFKMKNNIKYRGVNSYALSGGKINSYKFIKACILFVLMIVTIFSTIRFKLSQKITNTK